MNQAQEYSQDQLQSLGFLERSLIKVKLLEPAMKQIKAAAAAPRYQPESLLLAKVLKESWASVSKELFSELKQIFGPDSVDTEIWERSQKLFAHTGIELASIIRPKVSAILSTLADKAHSHYEKEAQRVLKKESVSITRPAWESWLLRSTTEQTLSFVEKYPERLLHPELSRLITSIASAPTQYSEKDRIDALDRLERLSSQNQYWEQLSSTQANFLWNSEAIFQADATGITHLQIANPMDSFSCEVCKRLHGHVFTTQSAKDKVTRMASLTDPDELRSNFPFPREADVATATADQIAERQFQPPIHSRCRCQLILLWSDEPLTVTPSAAPIPEQGLKVFPGDSIRAQKYEDVYDSFDGFSPEKILSFWKNDIKLGKPGFSNIGYAAEKVAVNPGSSAAKLLQLTCQTAEGSKAQIQFPANWAGSKDAAGITEAAKDLKLVNDTSWIQARATAQAYQDASPEHTKRITLYQWLPGHDAKKIIEQAVREGESVIPMAEEPLSFWSSDFQKLLRIQESKGGAIFRREFNSADIVLPPQMLGELDESAFLVRNLAESMKFNLGSIQTEVAADGLWNPVK